MICVPVAGPWVLVPTASAVPRQRVEYQMTCPRGYIVGGLDAELSDRAIDVHFYGKLGSPVNPGITTSRAAVFVATFAGGAGRATTFKPHLGCVPASGGGGGPVPFRLPSAAAVPPGQPPVRRLRTVRLRAGATQRAAQGCGAGERLVGAWHAVGFQTRTAPTAVQIGGVHATHTVRAGRVAAVVRTSPAVAGVRAIVQVGAVCAGGS